MTNILIGGLATLSLLAQGRAPGMNVINVPSIFDASVVQSAAPRSEPESRVERGPCNMPVVRANPNVDRKMIILINPREAQAKIRAIEPSVCWNKEERPKK